jgi:tetratricopeptide (TPR) repeat protein
MTENESAEHDRRRMPPPGSAYEIPEEGSLGLLALGAVGLQAWREKRAQLRGEAAPELPSPTRRKPHSIRPRKRLAKRRKRLARKVLLIGWDAADWKVIHPLLDAGLMPNLATMVEGGVIGNLATLDPPLSPMLWTSIATGMTADKHGVLGFTQPDLDHGRIRPVLGSTRKVKAVWNILNQEGFRSHVIGWWPSHPAEPINGVYVSNFYHRASAPYGEPWPLMEGAVHPAELAETLAALRIHPGELTSAHILPFVPRAAEIEQLEEAARGRENKRLGSVGKIIAEAATVHAAATWVMEHEPWDFMAVYYDAIDHFGHGFMKFHPPRREFIPEELYERYNAVVTAGYRFHDMLLGRLLHLAGPDTTVILISDHGFHPDHLRPRSIPKEPAGPAAEHRTLGVFCMRGPHILRDERVYGASLLNIAPTVLTLFGLPVGRDMDGQPLVTAFDKPVLPDYIPSWEEVPGEDGMIPQETRHDPWAEQAVMDQLVALGYIEPPGENAQKAIEGSVRESKFYLARVYLSTGRKVEALPLLEALYAEAPDQRRYALRLAQCYRDVGRLEECRRVVEAVIAQEEKRFPALDLLEGTLLLAEGKPEEALVCLLRAEEADPQRPDLHQRIGSASMQMRQWDLAERAYRKALEIDPESAEAFHGLALALLRQERFAEAADAALTSVGLIYFQPVAHFHLGEALVPLGEYERAAEAYRVAIAQAPGMRRAHLRLAELYEHYLDEPVLAEKHRRFAQEHIREGG